MAVMTDMPAATALRAPAPAPAGCDGQKDAEKLRFIEEMTSDVDAVQERVLAEILARNAGTEYLARCGLAGATDRAAFRAKVPVVTYEDLQPDIQRIANGDRSPILSAHPISEFLTRYAHFFYSLGFLPVLGVDVALYNWIRSLPFLMKLWDFGRRAQADANYQGGARPAPAAVQPPYARHEPVISSPLLLVSQ
jgi:hypothetical protein